MQNKHKTYRQLNKILKSTPQLIELNPESTLSKDINTVCNYLGNPNFQMAVFGPFNHGKSTLLNAVLGTCTLPVDLIPTTGAAISIKYGETLQTKITFTDGKTIERKGTKILSKFAVLDKKRQMQNNVASVEVFCPHPLLQRNLEFIDLPGTNDMEAQDNLVKDKLLGADLVIQVLDARKLMTLGEREKLRDWLLEREIKTVIFVANFLNLLAPEEQQQVYNRLLFVGQSFRSHLPPGFSNLYRVDALPALRARLKNDLNLAESSGLVNFEKNLQHIIGIFQQNYQEIAVPRIETITNQIQPLFLNQIEKINSEITKFEQTEKAKIEIKQKARDLIKLGLKTSILELETWLKLPNLLPKYQGDLAVALAENNFSSWQIGTLKKDLAELQLAVMKWLYQAFDFFQTERPEDLKIPVPDVPKLELPPKPNNNNNNNELRETGSIAVGSGVGWLLGGPVGAAVVGSISYLLNKNLQNNAEPSSQTTYHQEVAKICIDAAEKYLSDFSIEGLYILTEYEQKANQVINLQVIPEPIEMTRKRESLQKIQQEFQQLQQELAKLNIANEYQPKQEKTESVNTQKTEVKVEPKTEPKTEVKVEPKTEPTVELKPQPITSPPPPPSQKVSTQPPPPPKQTTQKPPMNRTTVEAKFRAWELEEEIAQMKANVNAESKQQPRHTPTTQADKDRIIRAYKILGLEANASFSEVKQTYKNLVKKWHPDLFVNQPEMQNKVQEKMRLLNAAYKLLEAYYK